MVKLPRIKYRWSIILAILLPLGISFAFTGTSYNWQGTLLVVIGIAAFALCCLPIFARMLDNQKLTKILTLALVLKLGFSMINYYFAFVVYGGTADAHRYSNTGIKISQYIWQLDFSRVAPFLNWGTEFIEFLTGVLYSIIGPSIHGGFLFFAFLSFLGSYFFYRAYQTTFPNDTNWLYIIMIFFFPSILYWPSAIGKDALMALCLGLFTLGCAQIIRSNLRGVIPILLGFVGMLWIRPHIAAISVLSFGIAFLLPSRGRRSLNPVTLVIGFIFIAGLSWYAIPQIMSFLNLETLSMNEIISAMQQQQELTSEGGSAIQVTNLSNPIIYLTSPITLLFRPFPWEAHNLQALVESMSGMIIFCLTIWRLRSIGRALSTALFSDKFLRYVLIYTIIFIVVFSSLANLGLLARERVMLLPFFFILLSYGYPEKSKHTAAPQSLKNSDNEIKNIHNESCAEV